MNSHSAEQVVSLFGDGGTYEAQGTGGPISDGQLVWFLNAVWQGWRDLTFTPQTVTAQDNRVVIEWRSRAMHRNAQVLAEGVTVIEIDGDHIRRARTYSAPIVAADAKSVKNT